MPSKEIKYGDCPHCHREGVQLRARGICRTCYKDPSIRFRYFELPSSTRQIKGPGRPKRGRRKKPSPTIALPGTEEKIAILIKRALAEEDLWHPLDAIWEGVMVEKAPGNREHVKPSPYTICTRDQKKLEKEKEEEWWENLLGEE